MFPNRLRRWRVPDKHPSADNRAITGHAFRHLGLVEPTRDPAQFGLFGSGEEG
jgi:hypothetical protein